MTNGFGSLSLALTHSFVIGQGLRTKIIEHPEHDERKRLSKAHDVAFLTPMKKE
jgi:hypothetical protein